MKTFVGSRHVTVGIKAEKVTDGLDGIDRCRDAFPVSGSLLHINTPGN